MKIAAVLVRRYFWRMTPEPAFVPPAPKPRSKPPSLIRMLLVLYRNPIELWGEPSYNEPWISIGTAVGGPLIVANDPGLVRHILVENAGNYRMAYMRQAILRPILKDGLLTAEGDVWKRSRKAIAPIFTPRHIAAFAPAMRDVSRNLAKRYQAGETVDFAREMTRFTYEILAQTLFSGEIVGDDGEFERQIDRLFETAARIDPLDVLRAPSWLPRLTRIRGRAALAYFRGIVADTIVARESRMAKEPHAIPHDFLSLLLKAKGSDGLTADEVADNIITFIGAGHETTARALAWTVYLLGKAPNERAKVEEEIDRVITADHDPAQLLDHMPVTRAAFEEAMRLYPPAPSISRESIRPDRYRDLDIVPNAQVLIMPWTIHRHRKLWDHPDAFIPARFAPENRERIDRFQYMPFGTGPRTCIGASFAMQEAMIVLSELLSRFRFEPTPATQPWPVQKLTVQPEGGIPMRIEDR
jgi:cytochrome P450